MKFTIVSRRFMSLDDLGLEKVFAVMCLKCLLGMALCIGVSFSFINCEFFRQD